MAKMFYDLSEAASKLGKSEDEVREMSARGEIQEFRDGEKLIFKVDQIDLLAGDDDHDAADMSSMIPLADTGMGTAMGGSDAGESVGLDLGESFTESGSGADAGSRTGISVFDVDDTEEADPAAQTQVSDIGSGGLSIESLGSGSGLMDLTRESDDTSLGAEGLLDDIYADDATGGGGFNETAEMGSADESGLFEGGDDDAGVGLDADAAPAGMMVAAEPYDGTWSGITGGLMLGAIAALLIGMTVMIMTIVSGGAGGFVEQITGFMDGNIMIQMGILAGAAVVFAVIGMVLGKKG